MSSIRNAIFCCDAATVRLQFVVTPLNGRNAETKVIPLTDGGTDGAPFTRYHMEMKLAAPDKVLVKVTDLGFGEFFAPGGRVWEESFQIG